MSSSIDDNSTMLATGGATDGQLTRPTTLNDPVPSTYPSIWDAPYISKVIVRGVNREGREVEKKEVFCWHCKRQIKGGWNATKALAHVAKKANHDVKACTSNISPDHIKCYSTMYNNFIGKKVRSEDSRVKLNLEADRHDASVMMMATGRKKIPPRGPPTMATLGRIGSSVSSFSSPRSIQLKLDGSIPNPQAEARATTAVTSAVLRLGLSFSLVDDPLFCRMCMSFRGVSDHYKFPSRESMRTVHLNDQYNAQQERTYGMLATDADVFGLTVFGDGATVRKMPLINVLAAGAYCNAGLLCLYDATKHLADGGTKDAAFIAGVILPYIEKLGPKNVDLVIMDGAASVQKGAREVQALYPHISTAHGAEHVSSLLLADVAKSYHVRMLISLNRRITFWFNGTIHSYYAVFRRSTQAHNLFSGRPLSLILPSDTRMGGHFISFMRLARLKQPILDTLTSAALIGSKFPLKLKRILQDDEFWKCLVEVCVFVGALMRVLRAADSASAGMHQLCYFAKKAGAHMLKTSDSINKMYFKPGTLEFDGSIWKKIETFLSSQEAILKGEDIGDTFSPIVVVTTTQLPGDDSAESNKSDSETEPDEASMVEARMVMQVPKHLSGNLREIS
jgi:Protein of unknown function (DUF 659)